MIRGEAVPFESTLERDLLLILDFDPAVARVRAQPLRIHWRDRDGRRRRYTPDFLVEHRAAPPLLCEVKHRADFWAEWPAAKPRYRAARLRAREAGMRFAVLTEVEIRGPYLENVVFLRGYAGRAPDRAAEEALLHTLAVLGEATPRELLAAAYAAEENRWAAVASLWRLLAARMVEADLSVPLTMRSPLRPAEGRR